ncbi:MAG TPA: MBL fold metallo-hydrolase [Gemmatimonadaceae bacterium]
MKITLVSHASLLVETNGFALLSDPWYAGRIYQNAWELAPPPPVLPDFRRLDGLFISHAHPDHYHVPTLEEIRDARGRDLPIFIAKFFHDTIGRDLRALGFTSVTQMRPGSEIRPAPRVRLYSQQFRMDDSLLVVAGDDDETLININDTPLRGSTLADLARRYPSVDYCAAQFAIAQGYPYCYDNAPMDFNRGDLVKRFDSFATTLRPRHMIPFASFVRFCNEDNAHMNAHKMGLAELTRVSAVPLTILHPGDAIERGTVQGRVGSREHFECAQRAAVASVGASPPVSIDDLDDQMTAFVSRLSRRVPAALLKKLPRFVFELTDAPWAYVVSQGEVTRVKMSAIAAEPIRYRLTSEVASASVQHDWGWADLSIGARFRAHVAPGWEGKEIWFWIIPMLGGEGYLTIRSLWFLRPRALQIWWGRRLEVLDYVRSVFSGRFMTQVVRKKTSALS